MRKLFVKAHANTESFIRKFGETTVNSKDADNYISATVEITGTLLQEQLTQLEQFCISIKETA